MFQKPLVAQKWKFNFGIHATGKHFGYGCTSTRVNRKGESGWKTGVCIDCAQREAQDRLTWQRRRRRSQRHLLCHQNSIHVLSTLTWYHQLPSSVVIKHRHDWVFPQTATGNLLQYQSKYDLNIKYKPLNK